jgi:hypothetical protein
VAAISTPVQIAGVEKDGAADDGATVTAGQSIPDANLCFFRTPANHSLLSKFDAPHEDKFWLPSLTEEAIAFITDGTPFQTGAPSTEASFPRCFIQGE